MAQPYLSDLEELVEQWVLIDDRVGPLECRHFFSGAAVYREGAIIASLSPVGLAFMVPEAIRTRLIESGDARELRYFPKAPVKKDYVLFPSRVDVDGPAAVRLLQGEEISQNPE